MFTRCRPLPPGRAAAPATFFNCRTPSSGRRERAVEESGRDTSVRTEGRPPNQARCPGASPPKTWALIISVFLPFTAGYYLSYVFRTINTSISPALASEFGLEAAELGLLASIYFLVFAGAQIPIGVLLDRFGPRRVQGVLLVIAAGGATLFGTATGFFELLAARAMIGLGVAAALMAGLKAVVLWFPRERVALVNGYMIMLGSFGAVTATAPAEWLQELMGWRGLFEVLTLATIMVAGTVYLVVPKRERADTVPQASQRGFSLKNVFADPRFWRIAPLSATCVGSSWALQSLWAGPWLADVEGFDRQSLVTQLFYMALAISVSAWLLGTIADRLRRRGIRTEALLAIVAALFILAQLVLVLRVPSPSLLPWLIISMMGAATVLSYAVIAEYFPVALAARANGVLNLLHFGWAFLVQSGIGVIVGQWPGAGGHYPLVAYQTAFGLSVVLQAFALLWFGLPWLANIGRRLLVFWRQYQAEHHAPPFAVIAMDGAILEPEEGMEW